MSKTALHVIIDGAAFLLLLALASTGVILQYVLPRRSGGETLLGLNRHDWGDLHFAIAFTFLLLIAVHLAVHWKWICSVVPRVCRGEMGR